MIVWGNLPKRLQVRALQSLRDGANRLDTIAFMYRKDRQAILDRKQSLDSLSESAIAQAKGQRAQALEAVQRDAVQKLNAQAAEFQSDRREVLAAVQSVIGPAMPKDTSEALLQEMRERSAWERIKPVLDKMQEGEIEQPLQQIIAGALDSSDEYTLSALRKELPLYAQSRNRTPDIGIRVLNDQMRAARPDVGVALDLLDEVERGTTALIAATSNVSGAISKNVRRVNIAGWDGEGTQTIETGLESEGAQSQSLSDAIAARYAGSSAGNL